MMVQTYEYSEKITEDQVKMSRQDYNENQWAINGLTFIVYIDIVF